MTTRIPKKTLGQNFVNTTIRTRVETLDRATELFAKGISKSSMFEAAVTELYAVRCQHLPYRRTSTSVDVIYQAYHKAFVVLEERCAVSADMKKVVDLMSGRVGGDVYYTRLSLEDYGDHMTLASAKVDVCNISGVQVFQCGRDYAKQGRLYQHNGRLECSVDMWRMLPRAEFGVRIEALVQKYSRENDQAPEQVHDLGDQVISHDPLDQGRYIANISHLVDCPTDELTLSVELKSEYFSGRQSTPGELGRHSFHLVQYPLYHPVRSLVSKDSSSLDVELRTDSIRAVAKVARPMFGMTYALRWPESVA